MSNQNPSLLAGAAETDITPPLGTTLAGALRPRIAEAVDDPLFVKALVLRLGDMSVAHLAFDLVQLDGQCIAECVAEVERLAGVPAENVFCTTTHTHSGPLAREQFPKSMGTHVNKAWRKALPSRAGEAAECATACLQPVRASLVRAYAHGISHYRRLEFKDGRHINTWLLNGGEAAQQCIGAAGPIDPELLSLIFENAGGDVVATVSSFALHACSGGGGFTHISADYPGALAKSLREHFGEDMISLFLPAAGGNINPIIPRQEAGAQLAGHIIAGWAAKRPIAPVKLEVRRATVPVSLRDMTADQDAALASSQWPQEHWAYFKEARAEILESGITALRAHIGMWCLGDVALATVPGELFVEYGMEIKRRSPFAWTIPVAYTGDNLGYLITETASKGGGYEALLARQGMVSPDGCRALVDGVVGLLASVETQAM